MCAVCGCSEEQHDHAHADAHADSHYGHTHEHVHAHDGSDHSHTHSHDGHTHAHSHDGHAHTHNGHEHAHGPHTHEGRARENQSARLVRLEADILGKNALLAAKNRGYFEGRRLLALNLVSSPGSGKTTLLERTIRELGGRIPFSVIQGDQATERDAERIRRAGAPAVQLVTGTVCHLDAAMVDGAVRELDPPVGAVLAIENVGNLVCPALFDLGEKKRVVVASYAEGDDKPLKYPYMFRSADLVVLNKVDLAPHVEFDAEQFRGYVASLNPRAQVLELSATRGDGMQAWYDWLEGARA